MMDLVKEKREQRDQEETNKIMEAIHSQARDNYYIEKGKRFLKRQKNKRKKEHEQKILEFIVCSVLVILPTAFLIFALVTAY
jgi:hypothetical protein